MLSAQTKTPVFTGAKFQINSKRSSYRAALPRVTMSFDISPAEVGAQVPALWLCPLLLSRGICLPCGTCGRTRTWGGSRLHSQNPIDRACRRSHGAANDGTDWACRPSTCIGALLSTADCSLCTCNGGSHQRYEQGSQGYFAHLLLH